ncbi:unnamed protein product, partial [marine sediment metagenome]
SFTPLSFLRKQESTFSYQCEETAQQPTWQFTFLCHCESAEAGQKSKI